MYLVAKDTTKVSVKSMHEVKLGKVNVFCLISNQAVFIVLKMLEIFHVFRNI